MPTLRNTANTAQHCATLLTLLALERRKKPKLEVEHLALGSMGTAVAVRRMP